MSTTWNKIAEAEAQALDELRRAVDAFMKCNVDGARTHVAIPWAAWDALKEAHGRLPASLYVARAAAEPSEIVTPPGCAFCGGDDVLVVCGTCDDVKQKEATDKARAVAAREFGAAAEPEAKRDAGGEVIPSKKRVCHGCGERHGYEYNQGSRRYECRACAWPVRS